MTRAAWIVFDLGFGDAGKGATVDFLVRDCQADLVIRYHGGAQAGHNVVAPNGRHHTFSQFGAGTFVPGTRTLLGPDFVFHPGALAVEHDHLRQLGVTDALARLHLDESALVISPFQQAAGRLRELARRDRCHGTCGIGFGEAVQDALSQYADTIRARDLNNHDLLAKKLCSQQYRKQREFSHLDVGGDARAERELGLLYSSDMVDRTMSLWKSALCEVHIATTDETSRLIRQSRAVVCEGSQGVLLDQDVGFHPHTTWSDCTPRGALTLLAGRAERIFCLGVMRSYMFRHGTGPLPTHDPGCDDSLPEPHNDSSGWQGPFRRGRLDLVLLKYALNVCGGADGLAVTLMDRVGATETVCHSYHLDGVPFELLQLPFPIDLDAQAQFLLDLSRAQPQYEQIKSDEFINVIQTFLGVPVSLISYGPTASDRRWIRKPSIAL